MDFKSILRPVVRQPLKPPSIRTLQYHDTSNPQITILNLMAITATCAVTITVTTAIGFFGVHAFLIACIAVNVSMTSILYDRPAKFRFWNQFIWGILMPVVCIFGDPFVFGNFELGKVVFIHDYGIACYSFIAWQIFILAISWVVPEDNAFQNEFVSGTLMAGGVFSLVVAVLIVPFTAIGILAMGLGIPGITPWFTGFTYMRTAKMHFRRASTRTQNDSFTIALLGFSIAVAIGIIAYVISINFDFGFDRQFDDFGAF